MPKLMSFLKKLAIGVGAGLLGVVLAWFVGLFSVGGSYWLQKSTVLALETLVALVLLGGSLLTLQFGRMFQLKLQEEDYQRRSSMVPTLVALSVTLLISYLLLAPYTSSSP